MTREIPLGRGYVALVDDADHDRIVAAGPWHAVIKRDTVYAVHTEFTPPKTFRAVFMHRLFHPNAEAVDHINRDTLDNRRCNLRPATAAQNSQNRRKRADSKQPYKGIRRMARGGPRPWIAAITTRGEVKHLGMFATPEEAARAYDAAALKHHGEFAVINFPEQEKASL